jgi:uncharacterized DUF497 family protein
LGFRSKYLAKKPFIDMVISMVALTDDVAFEWDEKKNEANIKKHGVSFFDAQRAFLDRHCLIAKDLEHSQAEQRYFCFGKIDGDIMTVRFTYRGQQVRIIGAGYWRAGRKIYDKKQG